MPKGNGDIVYKEFQNKEEKNFFKKMWSTRKSQKKTSKKKRVLKKG